MAKPRISTLFLVIALLTSIVAAVNFYVARNTERATRIWTEGQLEKVRQAKKALEEEKEELLKAKAALEEQVNDVTAQAKTIEGQLVQEKRSREALATELAQIRKESTQLKSQLETEKEEKRSLTADLAKAKQSYQALSNELTTLRQAKEALEKRVKEMLAARAKEAEQIVVSGTGTAGGPQPAPAGTQTQAPTIAGTETAAPSRTPAISAPAAGGRSPEGKVLVVNREFHFVVVNLGSKDGVKQGSQCEVVRGGKRLVTVEVEKVYDNMSAANMLEEERRGAEVEEGDSVRLIS